MAAAEGIGDAPRWGGQDVSVEGAWPSRIGVLGVEAG